MVETCTIITCEPNELMAELHDRMPVILDLADHYRWLDPSVLGARCSVLGARCSVLGAEELLRPCPAEWLEAVPISTSVNSPANDDESIIQPEGEPLGVQPALL